MELQALTEKAMQSIEIPVTPAQCAQFARYGELLIEWNEKMNLTAITQPEEVAIKHFADSALFLRAAELPIGARVIDIGTGAGFPGIPLKILRPDIELTLLDSLQKRLTFLQAVCGELGLNAVLLHQRAEELPKKSALRESFDAATARAVAKLDVLCKYCLPYVKKGGLFVALKGPGVQEELEAGNAAAAKYGAMPFTMREFDLPGAGERKIVITRKR